MGEVFEIQSYSDGPIGKDRSSSTIGLKYSLFKGKNYWLTKKRVYGKRKWDNKWTGYFYSIACPGHTLTKGDGGRCDKEIFKLDAGTGGYKQGSWRKDKTDLAYLTWAKGNKFISNGDFIRIHVEDMFWGHSEYTSSKDLFCMILKVDAEKKMHHKKFNTVAHYFMPVIPYHPLYYIYNI